MPKRTWLTGRRGWFDKETAHQFESAERKKVPVLYRHKLCLTSKGNWVLNNPGAHGEENWTKIEPERAVKWLEDNEYVLSELPERVQETLNELEI